MQRGALKYGRVWQTLQIVYAEQGLRGLYSGTVVSAFISSISTRTFCTVFYICIVY